MDYVSQGTKREDNERHVDTARARAKLQLLRSFIKSGVDISTCSDGLLYVVDGLQYDLNRLDCDRIDMTKEQCADLAQLLDIPSETLWDGVTHVNTAVPF